MVVPHSFLLRLLLFFLLASSTTTLTNDLFHSRLLLLGRTLLQQKTGCSIDFENQNYTIITSQCKGPKYGAKECCGALKELACPFAETINDMKTDCATTLFSYINIYGNYPPGLFSNLCHDNKDGISCKQILEETKAKKNESTKSPMLMILLTAFFLLLSCTLLTFP